MTELQLIKLQNATEKRDLSPAFDLPQNYSTLINKVEELALGLDSVLSNLSLDRKAVDIALGSDRTGSSTSTSTSPEVQQILDVTSLLGGERTRSPHLLTDDEVHLTRVVSDIWIGVILTLLMVSVVFFICSCFLYHKFQQWKNSYRTTRNETIEICRRYPTDLVEAESLPSYTIVSGLPSYDDALDEFRKAGILLTPHTPMIKIFESDTKNTNVFSIDESLNGSNSGAGGDSISMTSTACACNQPQTTMTPPPNNPTMNACLPTRRSHFIELTPDKLAMLSRKRLSLQIAFNNSLHRNSRRRIDLYRAANRNNHMRSRAPSSNGGSEFQQHFPNIHRSTSASSLSTGHQRLQQHRGSLC